MSSTTRRWSGPSTISPTGIASLDQLGALRRARLPVLAPEAAHAPAFTRLGDLRQAPGPPARPAPRRRRLTGRAALDALSRRQTLAAACVPPQGNVDAAAWKAYLLSCSQAEAAAYVEKQLGVPVQRYYHNGQIDYGLLAMDLARKQSGLPLSDACSLLPADMSGPELQAYALRCGTDAAADYVKQQTGVDARQYIKNGAIDWKGVGGAVATHYFGSAVDFNRMFNADGSLNYQDIAGQAGGVAAAAVCTAYGAGALAPACGWLGNQLGRAIYSVGEAFVEFLGFDDDDDTRAAYVYHATAEDAQRWTATWFVVTRPEYLRRVLAIRGAAVTACAMAAALRDAWNAATGEELSVADMLGKMFEHGLVLPPGWAGMIGTPPIPAPFFGLPYKYGDQADGTSLSLLYDWQVAQRAFGQPPQPSIYDVGFIAKPITDAYLTGQERVILLGFGDSSESGGAYLAWVVDPDGGPPLDPAHTAPGQYYTNRSAYHNNAYVPAAQAMTNNTYAGPSNTEPPEVSIFDPRAGRFGAVEVGCSQGEIGAYNFQTKASLGISQACREKVAMAWEAQFWAATDKVQVAYNSDARKTAETAGPDAPGVWVRSIQTSATAVRRELEGRSRPRTARKESAVRVVLRGAAKAAGVGAVILGAARVAQGLPLVPRSIRPNTWLKK